MPEYIIILYTKFYMMIENVLTWNKLLERLSIFFFSLNVITTISSIDLEEIWMSGRGHCTPLHFYCSADHFVMSILHFICVMHLIIFVSMDSLFSSRKVFSESVSITVMKNKALTWCCSKYFACVYTLWSIGFNFLRKEKTVFM